MAQLSPSALAAAAVLLLSSACAPDKKSGTSQDSDSVALKDIHNELPPLGEVKKCDLEPERAGPLRRAGKLDVELSGRGGKLSVKGAPALCGPMYDSDSVVLNVKAGDGLLFEACLPEGLVTVSSFKRTAGAQPLRSLNVPDGAEVSFQAFQGGTFSTRGDDATDTIVFGPDFWSVTAKVHMKDETDLKDLNGTIHFACPIPNPAALSAGTDTTKGPLR